MIPSFLKPFSSKNSDLIRIGSKHDGGYVINKKVLKKTQILISYGISDNFDFEKHFQKLSNCYVDSYDYSIGKQFWFKRFRLDFIKLLCLKIFKPSQFINIFKFLEFYLFYNKKKNNFYLKKISNKKKCLPFRNTIKTNKFKKIFLKIDIEGSEYEFISELKNYSKFLTGFVIEFHSVHKNLNKIKKFIYDLKNFKLIHVHGNTYSKINKNFIPDVLELTFSNKNLFSQSEKKNKKKYPLPGLDSANHKRHSQFDLKFRD